MTATPTQPPPRCSNCTHQQRHHEQRPGSDLTQCMWCTFPCPSPVVAPSATDEDGGQR